ncbi:Cupin-2 domain-containing protein [Fusarium sp. LHS14.1]|nr:Cupin-2 domain-containing protein [Fusarium sp. LHS14.1]
MASTSETEAAVQAATDKIIDYCRQNNSYPMWTVTNKVSKLSPNPKALPNIWAWSDFRKILLETCTIVPEHMAEHRALMMVNPGFPAVNGPSPFTTDTLYAGFQTVLPGETAPAHRHMAYAVRFILESDKGFTSVAGHKVYLEAGDLVLTPSWEWRYHGNHGTTPTIWVDCLDIPLHMFARINFLELYPTPSVPGL